MKIAARLNRAFLKGHRSYDTFLGDWWKMKSEDAAHKNAYRVIAQSAKKYLAKQKSKAGLLVDYACGTGGLLLSLAREFPNATIIGLDGSETMLQLAAHRLHERGFPAQHAKAAQAFGTREAGVWLVQTPLPDFTLPAHKADAAFFLFSNMNFSTEESKRLDKYIFGNRSDCDVARFLSRLPDLDHPKKRVNKKEIYEDMLYERSLAWNIHRLLRKGGWWFKADYSNCLRNEWSDLILWRMLFSESAFDVRVEKQNRRDRFEIRHDEFHRSGVIRDVYDQTHDPSDRTGGYVFSIFKAR